MPDTKPKQTPPLLTVTEDTWARSFHQELGLQYPTPATHMKEPETSSETQLLDILFEGAGLVEDPQIVAERLTARIIELSRDADAGGIARITQMLSDLGSLNNDVLKKAVPLAIKAVNASYVYPESIRTQNAAQPGDVPGLSYPTPATQMKEPETSSEAQLLDILFEGAGLVEDPQTVAERLTARIIELSKDADAGGIARITQMLNDLGSLNNDVLKKAVPLAIKAVNASHVYPESIRAQNAAQPGDVPRLPGEVTTHLLALLRKETRKPDLDPDKAELLEDISRQVKNQILSHKLQLRETHALLESVEDRLKGGGLGDLADQAMTLSEQLDKRSIPRRTRAHDAIYSRVLDSYFIADLVHKTPKPVLDSAQSMKEGLGKVLSSQTERVQKMTASKVQCLLKDDERFWLPECPELMGFIKRPPEDALKNLNLLLSSPPRNGYDTIAVPMLVVKITQVIRSVLRKSYPQDRKAIWVTGKKHPDFITYMYEALHTYEEITMESNRTRGPENTGPEFPNAPGTPDIKFGRTEIPKSVHAGITLGYQPASVTFEEGTSKIPSDHPADIYVPRLQEPSQSQRMALSRGIPVAGGVSGSTNVNLYFLKYLKDASTNVDQVPDPKNYMLATLMFMNYDGGHSVHEALWTGQMLDSKLKLDLGLAKINQDGSPVDHTGYVSDLNEFIDLYGDTETGQSMQQARESAFDATLDYFEQHSSYAADKPVGSPVIV